MKLRKPNLNTWRRLFQVFIAVAFIIIPILNRTRYSQVYGNFLSFHLFGIPIADPLAVLQLSIKNFYLTLDNIIGALLPLTLAFVLGTVFCSWICPYGLFSEWTQKLSRRFLPVQFKGWSISKNGFPSKLIIFSVGFLVFLIFSTTPILNQLSLAAWYTRFFQYLFGQDIVSWCLLFLALLLVIEFFARKRIWCKYICPQSILIILSKMLSKKRLKVVFTEEKCICKPGYERCLPACHLTLNPKNVAEKLENQCSNCGSCVVACRKMGRALRFEFPMASRLRTGSNAISLQQYRPVLRRIFNSLLALTAMAGVTFVLFYNTSHLEQKETEPAINSSLLANKKISWSGSRAAYMELLTNGTLICVGGDWPMEGFKGWKWQPVGHNGSFKIVTDPSDPASSILVTVTGTMEKNGQVTIEQFVTKDTGKPDSGQKQISKQRIEVYADLTASHNEQATSMDSRVVLDQYANEVYILRLVVYDPGGKKIQKVFSEGDLITTEGMLTAVHRWINSPEIIASEGQPPALPVHTRMVLRYRGDGHTETLNFVTDRTFDRTAEVFEDLWF
jgi:ferredoxin-type protein NapH